MMLYQSVATAPINSPDSFTALGNEDHLQLLVAKPQHTKKTDRKGLNLVQTTTRAFDVEFHDSTQCE